jgi:hypothetical protein
VPQTTEPIYAIRGWRGLGEKPWMLESTGMTYVWPDVEIEAFHYPDSKHSAPQGECTCGIYGYSTLEAALRSTYTRSSPILGVVLMWGSVFASPLQAGDGIRYRAARARVIMLDDSEAGRAAAEHYSLMRVPRAELLWAAREHGTSAPSSLWQDHPTHT